MTSVCPLRLLLTCRAHRASEIVWEHTDPLRFESLTPTLRIRRFRLSGRSGRLACDPKHRPSTRVRTRNGGSKAVDATVATAAHTKQVIKTLPHVQTSTAAGGTTATSSSLTGSSSESEDSDSEESL